MLSPGTPYIEEVNMQLDNDLC